MFSVTLLTGVERSPVLEFIGRWRFEALLFDSAAESTPPVDRT